MGIKHTDREQHSVWNGRDSLLPDLVDDDGRIVPLYGQSSLAGIAGARDPDDRECRYNQGRGQALARRRAQLAARRSHRA